VKESHKTSARNRLKTVRGHLDAVITMVEDDRYCPEIMKQVSALQASLEKVNRVLLQNHLETCVVHTVEEGRTAESRAITARCRSNRPSASFPVSTLSRSTSRLAPST
jgi:DNA-binding FrmR family transcriptional regulator